MIISEVKKLPVKKRFLYWIEEREKIRLARSAGKAQPYTDDEILQTYRFCNVRRMDDAVSVWLYDNWYKPFFNHKNMLVAVSLARFFNLPAVLDRLTYFVFNGKVDYTGIAKMLRHIRDAKKETIFNSAYMVRGQDGVDKIGSVLYSNVKPIDGLSYPTASMEEAWNVIRKQYGFGSFMAGQVVADLRWAVEGEWKDRSKWAPIGPGSNRGMARYFDEGFNPPYPQAEFLEKLLEVMKICKKELPAFVTKRLEAHDYQNCFCEFDKYERVLWGEGRPKRLFKGVGNE